MTPVEKKTDAEIYREVLEELKWDARVKATDVGVEVKDGVVTLLGTVASWAERLAAQEAAHRVLGVLDVANEITVVLPGSSKRTDADLAHAVRHALEWDVLVPHERIHVTISQGVVTLEGRLDTWTQYEDVSRCIRNLEGVREVRNKLEVEPAAVAPEELRRTIERALARHAVHSAQKVQIATVDGRVILTGHVPSLAERSAIEGAVRGTPGVHRVDNQITIR